MTTYKRIGLVAALLYGNAAAAQTSYPPAPPTPPDIVKAEYFIDNDPGLGQATSIAITPSKNIADKAVTVPLQGFGKGVHFLYLRTMDAAGKWSLRANKIFVNFSLPDYSTAGNRTNLAEAEYFFDTDPGRGNGIKIILNNSEEIQSQSIAANLPALSQGLHVFYLRTKDAAGKWSITAAKLFNFTSVFPYPDAAPAAIYVRAAEVFIDNDPGYGMGTRVNITPGGDISNFSFDLPLTGLSPGMHHLFIRGLERPWGLTAVQTFMYGSVVPLQWLYFKGEVDHRLALLKWGTAAEVNTDYFHIQHSTDGLHFVNIAEIPARSGSGVNNDYAYTHQSPTEGFNFYRIQQVDKDGHSTYSPVIQLLFRNEKTGVSLSPNPVVNTSYIIQNTSAFVRGFAIFSAAGQRVKAEEINAVKDAAWAIDLKSLQTGIYSIHIYYTNSSEVIRFVKK